MVESFVKSLDDTEQITLPHVENQDSRTEENIYNGNSVYVLRLSAASEDEGSIENESLTKMKHALFNGLESQDVTQFGKIENRLNDANGSEKESVESDTGTVCADETETLSNETSSQTAISDNDTRYDSDSEDHDSFTIAKSLPDSVSRKKTKALRKRDKGATLHANQDRLNAFDFVDSVPCNCGERICNCEHEETDTEDRKKEMEEIASKTLEFQFGMESQQTYDSQISSIINASNEEEGLLISDSNTEEKTKTAKMCSPPRVHGADTYECPDNISADTKRSFLSPDAGIPLYHSRSRKRLRNNKVSHDLMSAFSVNPANSKYGDGVQSPEYKHTMTCKSLLPTPLYRIHLLLPRKLFQHRIVFCLSGFSASVVIQLSALIKAYGGVVFDEEVLQRPDITNVILLATPNAWRKMKFMYAVARGIPVVHTEWLHTCIKTNSIVDCSTFRLPSGYSRLSRKYECFPVRNPQLFAGLTIGCPLDVEKDKVASTRELAHVMTSIATCCGATKVIEGLSVSTTEPVDIILSEEYTETCSLYYAQYRIPIKDFAWISECVIQQRLVDPKNDIFDVPRLGENVQSIIAKIVDSHVLKLHIGEMIQANLDGHSCVFADHFSMYSICEILELKRQHARKEREEIDIRVRVLKRGKDVMSVTRENAQERWIRSYQIQKRVVIVSERDFKSLQYRDENLYFFNDTMHVDA